jgi:hypothetical protein
MQNGRDLRIRVIFAACVDNVPALIDHPVIEQERLVYGAVALDIEAQAFALSGYFLSKASNLSQRLTANN